MPAIHSREAVQAGLLVLFSLSIFIADVFTSGNIAVMMLYCVIIATAPPLLRRYSSHDPAFAATALIVLGYLLTFRQYDLLAEGISRLIVILTVWSVSFAFRKLNEIEVLEKNITAAETNGIIVTDDKGLIRLFNPAAEAIFGYGADEVTGRNIETLLPGRPPGPSHHGWINGMTTSEQLAVRREGASVPVEVTVNAFYSNAARLDLFFVQDISARKSGEERYRREHEINENLFNTARCIVLFLDLDARVVRFNRYFEELTGYTLMDIRGRNWFEGFIPEQDQSRVREVFRQTQSGRSTDGTINAILTADGDRKTIVWSNTPLMDADGRRMGLLCCGQDVTDRLFAEDNLLVRTQQLISLSEIAYEALQEIHFQKLTRFILRHVINTLGAARAVYLETAGDDRRFHAHSISGSISHIFQQSKISVSPRSLAGRTLLLNQTGAVTGLSGHPEYDKLTELDEQLYDSALAVPVRTQEEDAVGIVCAYLENTHAFSDDEVNYLESVANIIGIVVERNRTQTRARNLSQEMHKLARINLIGELGSHIAHEINQPLTALMNYTQSCSRLIRSQYGELPQNIDTLLEKCISEAERASSIIRHIREYLESGQLSRSAQELNDVIRETCDIISPELAEKGIALSLDLQPGLPPAEVDKLQIQQVLINVIHNSIEAMATVINRQVYIRTSSKADGYLDVCVRDYGIGEIPDLGKEEFAFNQSTKPGGLGLGLSICKSIIHGHGGECWFARPDGGGTEFHFTLPEAAR